jgi:RimJ/RimL family protein N-acetyltransferase
VNYQRITNLIKHHFQTANVTSLPLEGENRDKNLGIAEYLLLLNDEGATTFVWNRLYLPDDDQIPNEAKNYPVTFRLLKERNKARDNFEINDGYDGNQNHSFESSRLVLRPADKSGKDLKTYQDHVLLDGDFQIMTELSPTKKNIELLSLSAPLSFVVEDKISHQMIGVIALREDDWPEHVQGPDRMAMEYYIFKKYRRHGYAVEAAQCLLAAMKSKQLVMAVPQEKDYLYSMEPLVPQIIRIACNSKNKASKTVALSLGFTYEGTLHHVKIAYGQRKYADMESYYLLVEKKQLLKRRLH